MSNSRTLSLQPNHRERTRDWTSRRGNAKIEVDKKYGKTQKRNNRNKRARKSSLP